MSVNSQDENGETPLHHAATDCDTTKISFLLAQGANPNIQDLYSDTPLHNAIYASCVEGVKLLMQGGANSSITNLLGNDGINLVLNIYVGNPEVSRDVLRQMIEIMLKAGANPDIINQNGYAPLHTVVINNDIKLLQIFLENGANPNIEDLDGNVPLSYSVFIHNIDMAKLLIQFGALNIQGLFNKTPLDYACFYGFEDFVRILKPLQVEKNRTRKNTSISGCGKSFPYLGVRKF